MSFSIFYWRWIVVTMSTNFTSFKWMFCQPNKVIISSLSTDQFTQITVLGSFGKMTQVSQGISPGIMNEVLKISCNELSADQEDFLWQKTYLVTKPRSKPICEKFQVIWKKYFSCHAIITIHDQMNAWKAPLNQGISSCLDSIPCLWSK